MRFGAALVTGVFSVLAVALFVHFVPGVGFPWLDEAVFVGYAVTGQLALAPLVGLFPLMVLGVAIALLAWRWEAAAQDGRSFRRGLIIGLGLYAVAVSITNPFLGMFREHMAEPLPDPIAAMLTSPGWVSLVESLWGHLFFGLVLGLFLTLGSRTADGGAQVR